MFRYRPSSILWCLASLLWGAAAVGVWAWTTRYELTTSPDDRHGVRQTWPEETSLVLADNRPTLLVFLHPRCPCTRASLGELERVLTGTGLSSGQEPKVIVVATIPSAAQEDWRDTDTVNRAATLPRAEIVWDEQGAETNRFGASTSGTVMLFGEDGVLQFAGGVTSSRGHEGDNVGSDCLSALLSQRTIGCQPPFPVFGCQLCIEPESSIATEPAQSIEEDTSTPKEGEE